MFFPIVLCLFVTLVHVVYVTAQNPTCKTEISPYSGQLITTCEAGDYKLPGNFDGSLLNAKIQALHISGIPWGARGVTSNSFATDSAIPFPKRATLTSFTAMYFNLQSDNPRFPFRKLLSNNVATIETMTMSNVKVASLNKEDFTGFNRLRDLAMMNCQVTFMSASAFEGLGVLPSGALQSANVKKLYFINEQVTTNRLSFDWTTLKPLTANLEDVTVWGVNIPNPATFSPFKLAKAVTYDINVFNADRVPEVVYKSFNPALALSIRIFGSTFCYGKTDCSCCEMKGFGDFLRTNGQAGALRMIQCGSDYSDGQLVNTTVFATDQYSSCGITSTTARTTPITTKLSTVTTTTATTTVPTTVSTKPPVIPLTPPPPVTPSEDNSELPFKVTCAKSKVKLPEVDLEEITSSTAEFAGDTSRKCYTAAYDLHTWILEKAGLAAPRMRRSVTAADGGVKASCTGKGVISVNEVDPEEVIGSRVSVQTEGTRKCREFYFEFIEKLMSL